MRTDANVCQRPCSRACRSISFPREGIRPPGSRPLSRTRAPGGRLSGDACSVARAGTRMLSGREHANVVSVALTRQPARTRRDGPGGTASEKLPSAALVVLPSSVEGAPAIRSRARRSTTTPAPAPATRPTIVALPERRVTARRLVPFSATDTGVVFAVRPGVHCAAVFAVRTCTGPYTAALVSVASVTTSEIACTPSGIVAVFSEIEPDALARHGTTTTNGFAQRPPLGSTTADATVTPSPSIRAAYTPEPWSVAENDSVRTPATGCEGSIRSPDGVRSRPPRPDYSPVMAIEDKDTASDLSVAPVVGPDDPRRFTDSGIEVKTLYTSGDVPDDGDLGRPGEFPYTRGVHAEMYRKRTWTMRQYAGYASAKESNERYKYLLKNGSTGLSMAFDLPTQLGLDSDDPRSLGEVGRTGVAIDTLDDMRTAFDGIPLNEVSTSMTINAPASVLLLLYELVAEEQGVDSADLRGTVQNDILKEYIARGNFIFPPRPSMRLTTDLFAYCRERIPRWNTVSISGYHFREKGCSAVQEIAFTLASGMAYVQAALDAGLRVDDFAPRLAFFFNGHNNVFQEVAKFRAARNMWAHAMKERFHAQDPRSLMLRFHTQTAGVTLTAQQPLNNVVRVALQGFAAVCGGTQSLHTNGFDEALALPSERAAKLALRTQQVIAHESGATDTVDPFAGSYYVEALTAEIERRAWALIEKVDEQGGSVNAIAFIKNEIEESAFGYHERYRTKQDIVVGVNEYVEDDAEVQEILSVDPESERAQVERLKAFKAGRDQALTDRRLSELQEAARGEENLLPRIRQALKDRASVGEVCGALREVFGEYQPGM